MRQKAVFPGSFAPFTIGHKSIIDRTLSLFDKIIIAIGVNSDKKQSFSMEDRIKWIKDIYIDNPKVIVKDYEGLTVDFCKKENAKYIIRGIRNAEDFNFEKNIAQMNYNLNNEIETILLVSAPEFSHISSTIVRDIIKNNGDVSKFIPNQINILKKT